MLLFGQIPRSARDFFMTAWQAFFLGVFTSTVPSVIFFAWMALRTPEFGGNGRKSTALIPEEGKCCCGAPLGPDGRCLSRYQAERAA
jgi:hypothetical protein